MSFSLGDKEQYERWDKYVEDKPELKEIIGQLAKGMLALKIQLDSIEKEIKLR